MDANGKINFFDGSYTQNGRSTFPFQLIPEAMDPAQLPPVDIILILNRNENIIPAVAKLTREQAAAYFMLGETKGTSAGGVEEAGKALRVPGTNPFFPLLHGAQGNRFLDLANKLPFEAYLMNTGWVGGADGSVHSKKVKIRHSSAVVQAIAEQSISWTRDKTFGYQIADSVPGYQNGDHVLLQPESYYKATERQDEYEAIVSSLKGSRVQHLQSYPDLKQEVVDAVS